MTNNIRKQNSDDGKGYNSHIERFKQQIDNTNDRLTRQYWMMTRAHKRYNRLFRQTHKTFQIHHLALLMVKDYITILVGTLQRIHRQYIRYESA